KHVNFICSRLSYVLSVLYKLRSSNVPKHVLISVYKSFFLPYVYYCCWLWGPMLGKHLLNCLQACQNEAVRIIFALPMRFTNIKLMLRRMNQLNTSEVILYLTALFAHDTLKDYRDNFLNIDLVSVAYIHRYSTRFSTADCLFMPRLRTSFARRFITCSITTT